MAKTVRSADGKTHNFPDDTPDDVIDAAMRAYATGNQPEKDTAGMASESAYKNLRNIPGQYGKLAGAAEAVVNVGGNMVGLAASGIAGIAGGIAGAYGEGGETGLEKAGRYQKWTQDKVADFVAPRTVAGQESVDAVGTAMHAAEKGVKYAGSGYAGLGALAGGASMDEAAGAVQDFQNTPDVMGSRMLEETGSPALATISRLLPDLAALGFVPSKVKPNLGAPRLSEVTKGMEPGALIDTPAGYGGVGAGKPAQPWSKSATEPPVSEFTALEEAVQARNAEEVARIVNANPAIVAAFDELGIKYAPQMVSENAAVRQTASGLKSAPESGLAALDEAVFADLRAAADELVNRYGTTERGEVDLALRDRFDTDNAALTRQTERAFEEIRKNVPVAERVEVGGVRDYIEGRINDLGSGNIEEGLANASRHEKSLWNITHKRVEIDGKPAWEANDPSYAALDSLRRDVGDGLDSAGIFANDKVGELKNTYGHLADAQQQAATRFGMGEEYKAANQLVTQRKAAEASSEVVLGRKMERGTNIDPVATALAKGQTAAFERLMKNTPAEQQAIVASAVLDKLIRGNGSKMGEGFLKTIELLERNPGSKRLLFSYLPKEAARRFEVIATASRGFIRSRAKDNRSNTANANAVIKAWEEGTIFSRVFAPGKKLPIAGDWIKRMMEGGPAKRVTAAENFLRSKSLDDAVREYAAGRTKKAEDIIRGTAAFNRWLATLPAGVRKSIQKEGVMAYLFATKEEK